MPKTQRRRRLRAVLSLARLALVALTVGAGCLALIASQHGTALVGGVMGGAVAVLLAGEALYVARRVYLLAFAGLGAGRPHREGGRR